MNTYAQTNLQLYGQLLSAGRPEQELRLIRDTYELALGLFAAQYRGNGKPFVSHLVGVASILTAHWQPIETIAAGLLHSVYSFGEFGDGTRGADKRKREEVNKTVGAVVEELSPALYEIRLEALHAARPEVAAVPGWMQHRRLCWRSKPPT